MQMNATLPDKNSVFQPMHHYYNTLFKLPLIYCIKYVNISTKECRKVPLVFDDRIYSFMVWNRHKYLSMHIHLRA